MKNAIWVLAIVAVGILILTSCGAIIDLFLNNANKSSSPVSLSVYITDRPLSDLENFYIDIESLKISYEFDGKEQEKTIEIATSCDLIALAGIERKIVGDIEFPSGSLLKKLTFTIKSATAVVSTERDPQNYGEKILDVDFQREILNDINLLVDFDLSRSLKDDGHGKFIFTPYAAAVVMDHTGKFSISGYFERKGEEEPISRAVIVLSDSVESTLVRTTITNSDGKFYFRYLNEGTYILAAFKDYEPMDIDVKGLIRTSDASTTVGLFGANVENVYLYLNTIGGY